MNHLFQEAKPYMQSALGAVLQNEEYDIVQDVQGPWGDSVLIVRLHTRRNAERCRTLLKKAFQEMPDEVRRVSHYVRVRLPPESQESAGIGRCVVS